MIELSFEFPKFCLRIFLKYPGLPSELTLIFNILISLIKRFLTRHFAFSTLHSAFYQWNELMCYETVPGGQGLCPPDGMSPP